MARQHPRAAPLRFFSSLPFFYLFPDVQNRRGSVRRSHNRNTATSESESLITRATLISTQAYRLWVEYSRRRKINVAAEIIFVCVLSRDACVRLGLARRCAQLAACGAKSRLPTSHRIGLGRVGRSDVSPDYGCLEKVLPPDLWREEFGDQVFVIRSQLGQIRLHFALRVEVIGIERARPT